MANRAAQPGQRTTVFGATLRSIRQAAGLSQGALAVRAGISEKAIGALERGDRTTPRLATVVLLAQALNASPAERERMLAAARGNSHSAAAVNVHANGHGLFAPPTPLIGRQAEVAAVRRLLLPSDSTTRLLTLIGAGGVGKTRVALAVSRELVDAFADGIWFVDLAPVHDYRLVAATVAHALDVREAGGRSARELLIDALRDRQLLLVLDNFEHVLDAVPLVAELLSLCPRLSALVTSRTALRVRAERRFTIEPLPLPAADRQHETETVKASEAVQLFLERAQAIVPDLELTTSNVAVIAAICRRLDGLPLAIELAAARTALLDPVTLLDRLGVRPKTWQPHRSTAELRSIDCPDEGELVDLPPRQRTVQATISWSYDLLTPAQQTVFACLAVFAGGCTLQSAQAVCAASLPADADVAQHLLALVESSLLQRRVVDAESGQPRFGMLETIHEDATRRLSASGHASAVRDRHLAFFLAEADRIEPHLHSPDQGVWADRLEREHDNLRAALSWAMTSPRPLLGLRLATTLRYFWYMHGHHREGREWLTEALVRATGLAPDVRGRGLGALGYLEAMQAEYGLARTHLDEALTLAQAGDDLSAIALAQRYLGFVAIGSGDPRAARTHLETSFAAYQDLGQDDDAGAFLMYLGDAALADGDSASARRYFEESRNRLRARGNATVLPYPVRRLGHLALLRGDLAEAVSLCLESLSMNRAVRDPQGIAACLVALGAAAAAGSAFGRAARLLGAADALLAAGSIELFAADRQLYDQTRDRVRQQLGDATFTTVWKAGHDADPAIDIRSFTATQVAARQGGR